eukprot:scaffold24231_cov30-Phaeocystis_antarctica.AAC.1
MAAAFALRHLTLETQSRGKLHPHGHLYVAHSRVKKVALVQQVRHRGPPLLPRGAQLPGAAAHRGRRAADPPHLRQLARGD